MYTKSYVQFFNGKKMPIVGLGTWQSPSAEIKQAIHTALDVGYRHIDTAYVYRNESAIGEALQEYFATGKLKREDLFIVTKLPCFGMHKHSVEKYLRLSLERLKLDYVDLYLVHLPVGVQNVDEAVLPMGPDGQLLLDMNTNLEEIWKGMESMVDVGLTKSIGLSNFNSKQIQRILKSCSIRPANLQVECHAYFPQTKLYNFCKEKGITFCAYAPIGNPNLGEFFKSLGVKVEIPVLINDPALKPLSKKYKKTPAQIVMRWLTLRGMVVIPKSTNPARIKENFEILDFTLSEEDFAKIEALNKNIRMFNFGSGMNAERHPEYPYALEF